MTDWEKLKAEVAPLIARRESMVDCMAKQMAAEMHANRSKGDGWEDAEPESLEYELLYHAVKLVWAGRDGDKLGVREYAADVANHAGMLADRLGALADAPDPAEGNASAYLPGSNAARELAVGLHLQVLEPPT